MFSPWNSQPPSDGWLKSYFNKTEFLVCDQSAYFFWKPQKIYYFEKYLCRSQSAFFLYSSPLPYAMWIYCLQVRFRNYISHGLQLFFSDCKYLRLCTVSFQDVGDYFFHNFIYFVIFSNVCLFIFPLPILSYIYITWLEMQITVCYYCFWFGFFRCIRNSLSHFCSIFFLEISTFLFWFYVRYFYFSLKHARCLHDTSMAFPVSFRRTTYHLIIQYSVPYNIVEHFFLVSLTQGRMLNYAIQSNFSSDLVLIFISFWNAYSVPMYLLISVSHFPSSFINSCTSLFLACPVHNPHLTFFLLITTMYSDEEIQ